MLKINHEKTVGILSIMLGVLFVVFFFEHKIGISYTIYTIILVGYYYFALHIKKEFKSKVYIGGTIYIILLSSVFFRSDLMIFRIFNFIIIPIFLCANVMLSLDVDLRLIVSNTLGIIFVPIGKMHKLFVVLFNKKKKNSTNNTQILVKVLMGIVISIPALFIVISLLTSADVVFADKLSNIVSSSENILQRDIIIKVLLGIIVATYFFGQIYYIFHDTNKKNSVDTEENDDNITKYKGFDRIITITFISILDIVYLSFCMIQFIYLFGGNNDLPAGYTYADYAREGFFQLVFLSVINIILIYIINKFYLGIKINTDISIRDNNYRKDIVVSYLLFTMVICTFVLIISSMYRLNLYEEAYGYTRLRLLVYMFIIFESVIMILVAINIWNKKLPITRVALIVALSSYLIINFINIDGIIAKENINRYVATGKIDLQYLIDLSTDAADEISKLQHIDKEMYNEYRENLIKYKLKDTKWQSFNLSQYNVKKLIE
ncbi:hypothetical protein AN1V17_22400 [Vallitalea sediminicola]